MKAILATPNQLTRRLRHLIKKSGWSVAEVSRRAYVEKYFIYDVLAGKNSNPSAIRLARIAKVLGVSLDGLMKDSRKDASAVPQEKSGEVETPVVTPSDHFIKLTEGDKVRAFDEVLQDVFTHAIRFCDGNKSRAADGLEMTRSRFYRKMGAQRELLSHVYGEKRANKQEE